MLIQARNCQILAHLAAAEADSSQARVRAQLPPGEACLANEGVQSVQFFFLRPLVSTFFNILGPAQWPKVKDLQDKGGWQRPKSSCWHLTTHGSLQRFGSFVLDMTTLVGWQLKPKTFWSLLVRIRKTRRFKMWKSTRPKLVAPHHIFLQRSPKIHGAWSRDPRKDDGKPAETSLKPLETSLAHGSFVHVARRYPNTLWRRPHS